MNLWKSIFTAELRRVRLTALLHLGLRVAAVTIILRQLHNPDSPSSGFLFAQPGVMSFLLHGLVALLVFRSAWQDSPSRTDSHLAFRPVQPFAVASAKYAAWLVLFSVPTMAAEWVIFHQSGSSAALALRETLLAGIISAMTLLTVLWVSWTWQTVAKTTVGVLAILATYLFIFMVAFSQYPALANKFVRFARDGFIPIFCIIWALADAVIAFLLIGLYNRTQFNGWVRGMISPIVIITGGLAAGYLINRLPRPPAPVAVAAPAVPEASLGATSMASVSFTKLTSQDEALLEVLPATPFHGPDQEVHWEFSKIPAGLEEDRDEQAMQRRPRTSHGMSLAAYNALASHLGQSIRMNYGIAPIRTFAAEIWVKHHGNTALSQDLSCDLKGNVSQWKVVQDRPLRSAEYKGYVTESYADFPSADASKDVFLIFSPADGRLMRETASFIHDLMRKRWVVKFRPGENGVDDFRRCRLIVLRPTVIRHLTTTWKASLSMPMQDKHSRRNTLSDYSPSARKAMFDWLEAHPKPPADAISPVMAAWLKEFLPMIPQDARGEIRKVEEIIREAAASHPVELVDAVNSMGDESFMARMTISDVLKGSLLGEIIGNARGIYNSGVRHGSRPGDERLVGLLGPYAASKARAGESTRVEEILFSVPQAVGLSEKEWVELFRLSPSARSYEALLKAGVPEATLQAETAVLLEQRLPLRLNPAVNLAVAGDSQASGTDGGQMKASVDDGKSMPDRIRNAVPDVELALASGHPRAPEWYLVCFGSLSMDERINLPSFDARGTIIERYVYESMTKYFVIPQDIPSRNNARLTAWFRSQKPDDFTFDPEIRKFRMR